MRARVLVSITLAALAVTALLWWRRAGDAHPAKAAPTARPAPPAHSDPSPAAQPEQPASAPAPTGAAPESADVRQEALDKARQTLELYRTFARFPPESRPADASQRHVTHWNEPVEIVSTLAEPAGGQPTQARVTLDRFFAETDQPITVTARVWRGDDPDANAQPIAAQVAGDVEVDDPAGPPGGRDAQNPAWRMVAPLGFAPAGANTWVARFVPSQTPRLSERLIESRVAVWLSLGTDRKLVPLSFRYVTRPALTVRGLKSEAIEAGSLAVTLDIDLAELGPVLVQATLFDATGKTAIAIYDGYYHPVHIGPQVMPLSFFGKIIHDQGIDGPYVIGALHGHVRLDVDVPPEHWWSSPASFTTAAHGAAQFSADEWSSPVKDAKLRQYQDFIHSLAP